MCGDICVLVSSGGTKHLDPIGDGLRFFTKKKSQGCVPFVRNPRKGDVEMNAWLHDLQVEKKPCQSDFPLLTAVRRVLGND